MPPKAVTKLLSMLYRLSLSRYNNDMTMHQILVVEDDSDLSALLAEQIGLGGYQATTVATLAEARDALAHPAGFDLLLLDVGLPDGDGRTLCADLRRDGQTLPVIILSAHGDEDDVVQGLEDGADAYMRKPFHAAELMARLNHLLPRPA